MDDRLLRGSSQGGREGGTGASGRGTSLLRPSRLHRRLFCELNGKQREEGAITMNDKLL